MLFMAVFTFEPEKSRDVLKRRAEKGPLAAGKIIGEWSALAGGRVFRVIEGDDPNAIFAAARAWTDLGKLELIPVMATEDVIKVASSKK
jgi:hypothetical protein